MQCKRYYLALPLAINYIAGKKRSGFDLAAELLHSLIVTQVIMAASLLDNGTTSPKFAAMGLFNKTSSAYLFLFEFSGTNRRYGPNQPGILQLIELCGTLFVLGISF